MAAARDLFSYFQPTLGCWLWEGPTLYGYGKWRHRAAHRAVYQALCGPLPDEVKLDHLCENRLCVNPDHLDRVTQGENTRRAWESRVWKNKINRFFETGRYESSGAHRTRKSKDALRRAT